jgi:hypothetical protein
LGGGGGGTCRVEGADFYSLQITSHFRIADTLPMLILFANRLVSKLSR